MINLLNSQFLCWSNWRFFTATSDCNFSKHWLLNKFLSGRLKHAIFITQGAQIYFLLVDCLLWFFKTLAAKLVSYRYIEDSNFQNTGGRIHFLLVDWLLWLFKTLVAELYSYWYIVDCKFPKHWHPIHSLLVHSLQQFFLTLAAE